MSDRSVLLCLIRIGVFVLYENAFLTGEGVEDLWRRSFHAVPFVRRERAQVYLEKERKPGSPRTQSRAARAHIHARARGITRFTTPSHPSSPPSLPLSPPLSLSFPLVGRRLDVLFRFSCPPRLAPRSRSVFLQCSKPRAGPAITRSRLTVAPCMAACFMLPASHCDAHRERGLARCCISVEMCTRYPPYRLFGCF